MKISKPFFRFYIIMIFSTILIGCDKPQSKEDKVDILLSSWDTDDKPGIAVSIIKDGSAIYQKGYGLANLEYDIPISKSSVFHIASVSKQFTVFSILLLEKEGKLSLDDDIRKYIPKVPDFGETITLRHLASHTSGLRDQFSLLTLSGWHMDDVMTQKQILNLVYKQKALNSIPGTEFVYNNTGFILLAEIVTKVSGLKFTDYTQKYIFEPLGMTNSLFYDNYQGVVKNRVYSYHSGHYYKSIFKKSRLNFSYVGSTSLLTTVEDLSYWAMNFKTLKVGSEDIFNIMNKPATLNNGETTNFALGQFTGKYNGLNTIQHGGGDAGYRSFLIRFPDQDLSIIVLSNLASANPWDIAYDIAYIYLKDEFIPEKTQNEDIKEIDIPSEILDSYVGEYEMEAGIIIDISKVKNILSAKMKYPSEFFLEPQNDKVFYDYDNNVKIEFIDNGSDIINSLNITINGTTKLCQRLKPYNKTSIVKSEYIGSYFSDELETTYKVVLENNKLILRHYRLEDREMSLLNEDTFLLAPYSYYALKMIRDDKNNISGCTISSPRSKNIWFKKFE
ncbi:MAG: beta-lactamase family protein [Spirochaetaceae bacterium]